MTLQLRNAELWRYSNGASWTAKRRRHWPPEPEAIEKVCIEAWPEAHTQDELHDALVVLGFLTEAEGERGPLSNLHDNLAHGWPTLMENLQQNSRATVMTLADDTRLWIAAERLEVMQILFPQAVIHPYIEPVAANEASDPDSAVRESSAAAWKVWARTATQLAAPLVMDIATIDYALRIAAGRLCYSGKVYAGRGD